MSNTYTGANQKKDVEKALENRPVMVLYYKEGCPYCEGNEPAWKEAEKEVDGDINVIKVEAEAIPEPEESKVEGFPTMIYKKVDGSEKKTTGQKNSGKEILEELDVPKKKKGGKRLRATRGRRTRGRSLRRTFGRRNGKLGYRTLRHDISFI